VTEGDTALSQTGIEAVTYELTFAPGSREKPSLVFAPLELNDERSFQLAFNENHGDAGT
jgi:hypothetical protein